jgi:hypothetical protein
MRFEHTHSTEKQVIDNVKLLVRTLEGSLSYKTPVLEASKTRTRKRSIQVRIFHNRTQLNIFKLA